MFNYLLYASHCFRCWDCKIIKQDLLLCRLTYKEKERYEHCKAKPNGEKEDMQKISMIYLGKEKRKTLNVIKSVVPASIRTLMGVSSCLENARVRRNTAAESSFSIGASIAAADTPHGWVLFKKRHCSLRSCEVFLSAWHHELDGKISVGSLATPLVSWLTLDRPWLS